MGVFETAVISALLPAAVDGVKNLITRWSGGYKPANIEEILKLEDANIQRLTALAQLDNPHGTPSQWVVDLRASFRYIFAGIVILGSLFLVGSPSVDVEIKNLCLQLSAAAFSFIFGERMYLGFVGKK
ncbi:hypothetical protein [Microcystis sp. M42BS1]|uniref:hypothetical protein n=1 Tax=Microcystis sp. M42BS1 TaxID=2771192 RepID=UPI002584EDBB|nr:hypothetical protein [Microcystis sp. M42BS1]MCA2570653.1 hypothetical protein [Microcystis sp. M42BS1]